LTSLPACVEDQKVRIETGQIDGPYGRWIHTEGRWDRLDGLVELIWHFAGKTTFPRERIFPNGLLEIIVHLGERFREVSSRPGSSRGFHTEALTSPQYPITCINGLQTHTFLIQAPEQPCTVLGIRLTPAGAFALLNTSLDDIRDVTVDLADVVGRYAAELAERCNEVSTGEDRVRVAMRWVCERLSRGARIDPAIAWMVREIEQRNGSVSIGALREDIGFSKTRLVDTFRRQVGLSPKTFARVIRFRHVLRLIHAGAGSLSNVALDAGLYDQPHLNAEFKELSGFTPSEFLAAQRYSPTSLAES
jgi:AraC-like DNA-binding protein